MRRRDCLTGLCALAGLQFVPQTVFGLPEPIEESSENTFIYDVVVVGTGLAGHCAAISAKEAGAERVLMIDKAPLVGGHSALASGSIAFVDEKRQALLTRSIGLYQTRVLPEATSTKRAYA